MMNRRTEYERTMNQYIPIAGKPAEQGLTIPRFQEGILASVLMEHALDHLARSNKFSNSEDFKQAVADLLNVTAGLPTPPILNAWDATQGVKTSGNLYGFG